MPDVYLPSNEEMNRLLNKIRKDLEYQKRLGTGTNYAAAPFGGLLYVATIAELPNDGCCEVGDAVYVASTGTVWVIITGGCDFDDTGLSLADWLETVDVPTPGSPGTPGAVGPPGPGVPVGGTTGQLLAKIDAVNYNTQWVTPGCYLTPGGSAGQVLTKVSGVDCDALWLTPSAGGGGIIASTRAAILAAQTAGTLTAGAWYQFTFTAASHNLTGATLYAFATSTSQITHAVYLLSALDDDLWDAHYDIDTNEILWVKDNLGNDILGRDSVKFFPWGFANWARNTVRNNATNVFRLTGANAGTVTDNFIQNRSITLNSAATSLFFQDNRVWGGSGSFTVNTASICEIIRCDITEGTYSGNLRLTNCTIRSGTITGNSATFPATATRCNLTAATLTVSATGTATTGNRRILDSTIFSGTVTWDADGGNTDKVVQACLISGGATIDFVGMAGQMTVQNSEIVGGSIDFTGLTTTGTANFISGCRVMGDDNASFHLSNTRGRITFATTTATVQIISTDIVGGLLTVTAGTREVDIFGCTLLGTDSSISWSSTGVARDCHIRGGGTLSMGSSGNAFDCVIDNGGQLQLTGTLDCQRVSVKYGSLSVSHAYTDIYYHKTGTTVSTVNRTAVGCDFNNLATLP